MHVLFSQIFEFASHSYDSSLTILRNKARIVRYKLRLQLKLPKIKSRNYLYLFIYLYSVTETKKFKTELWDKKTQNCKKNVKIA